MLTKVLDAGAWDFGAPPTAFIKASSRGLLGADKAAMEKRAGAFFTHQLTKLAESSPSDEPLIHMLAVGATEDFGANRNGDGFTRQTCRDRHDTFKKRAFFYRHHRNKDPKKSYGRVKLSAWNEDMKRIELVVALNGSKQAAARHNALFADEEMEKLASGKPLGVSMACSLPLDICSFCGNKAPSRAQYCDSIENGGHCKAGGLKHKMGSVVEVDGDLHHLHADNPNCTFFDISHVFRPADRIAYVSGRLKAAADRCLGGAELAEALGVTAPYALVADPASPQAVQRLMKLAYRLSESEQAVAASNRVPEEHRCGAFQPAAQTVVLDPPPYYREKFSHTLKALAERRAVLPLPAFLQLFAGCDAEKSAAVAARVQPALPGVYTRLLSQADLTDRLSESPYTPGRCADASFRCWAHKHAEAWSLRPVAVGRRLTRSVLRGEAAQIKQAAAAYNPTADASVERLSQEYALYKLAFLGTIPEEDPELALTANLVLLQNYAH